MSFENFVDTYSALVRQFSTDRAMGMLRGFNLDDDTVAKVVAEHRRRCRRFIDLTDPKVLRGNQDIESWYEGPDFASAWCWPPYKALLLEKGFDEEAVKNIDQASTRIMAHLPHPQNLRIGTRGLVVGYVQSGKTANYTGLISKAADAGYKLFIVLAGMTSSLRQQTQKRLTKELCAPNVDNWFPLTDPNWDFREGAQAPAAMLSPKHRDARILAVVKKNTHILGRLKDFLERAGLAVLESCPTLIIDDEADQASINTKKQAEERSTINRRILEILGVLPKAAYVAYTATPFANVFIDPSVEEDLYPRDFIVSLPPPDAYFGAERVFGRETLRLEDAAEPDDGLDMIRPVQEDEPDEVAALKPPTRDGRFTFEPSMTTSLEDASLYFLLATACRYARGHQSHSSMLVHTTYFTYTHQQLQELLSEFLDVVMRNLLSGKGEWFERARRLWEDEQGRVDVSDIERKPVPKSFDQLLPHLPCVCERLEVVVDNGGLGDGLTYPDLEEGVAPKVVVAVGGNTLSRGLTLEGLVVSYFVRQAAAYDTLLQMGRWFGYRFGYEDLPRAWMPPSLELDFRHLATVEEELRLDIARYEKEKLSPRQFAVRVRTHPRLIPTSKAKMQNIKLTNVSFSNSREQTTFFRHDDRGWLDANIEACRELLGACRQHASGSDPGRRTWFDIPVQHVLDFLAAYRISDRHSELSGPFLPGYIRDENSLGGLRRWNVSIVSRSGSQSHVVKRWDTKKPADLGCVDLGLSTPIPCINRSRFEMTRPAYIKALTSAIDRVRDLHGMHELPSNPPDDAMIDLRNELLPDHGLLLLYPISKNSIPTRAPRGSGPSKRHDLEAVQHMMGLALVFPRARTSADDYVANNLDVLKDLYGGQGAYTVEDDPDLDETIEEELEG